MERGDYCIRTYLIHPTLNLEIVCHPEVVILGCFDTGMSFKDRELVVSII